MKKSFMFMIWVAVILTGCTGAKEKEELTTPKSHMGLTSKTISVNELTFHYVEKGSGDVILFLHGFPYFGESWYKLLHEFGGNYHAIAPDNRGYGYTEKPENVSDYHIEKLVSDAVQLITKLSPDKKVILVGHDWGAGLAWAAAQLHPELISKLIIINGVPSNAFMKVLQNSAEQRERSKYVGSLDGWLAKIMFAVRGSDLLWKGVSRLHEAGAVDDNFKHAFLTAWDQPDAAQSAVNWYVANFPEFDDIQDDDFWPSKDARVTVPSLLIWSKDDPAFTQDAFNAIPDYVDDLTIKVIDTSSHAPFLDHSEEVINYMKDFLK
jgi:pimeloyl-ACP methyl ester carboxylesterase